MALAQNDRKKDFNFICRNLLAGGESWDDVCTVFIIFIYTHDAWETCCGILTMEFQILILFAMNNENFMEISNN